MKESRILISLLDRTKNIDDYEKLIEEANISDDRIFDEIYDLVAKKTDEHKLSRILYKINNPEPLYTLLEYNGDWIEIHKSKPLPEILGKMRDKAKEIQEDYSLSCKAQIEYYEEKCVPTPFAFNGVNDFSFPTIDEPELKDHSDWIPFYHCTEKVVEVLKEDGFDVTSKIFTSCFKLFGPN